MDGLPQLWPHQLQGVQDTLEALKQYKRVCLTAPTGAGKTRIDIELINHWLDEKQTVAVVTNRKSLLSQLGDVLDKAGIDHGKRASGWSDEGKLERVQLVSLQTENARVHKTKQWESFKPSRAIFDEPHMMRGEMIERLMNDILEQGGSYVGTTATPLGLAAYYDTLVQAGTTSSLRACGALVPCLHWGPDEPDLRQFGKAARAKLAAGADLSEADQKQAFACPGIFGRVLEWYEKLNPQHRPTILFASGVAESLWFAEQFFNAGITAAHIDGGAVWINGEVKRSSKIARDEVLNGSRTGAIKVVCNRFVLREGIDAPWLAHGIFATIFGALQSYLQSGGRLLRAFPGLDSVTLQDHGGNWWRHGSLNADREWRLDYDAAIVAGLREQRLRKKIEREPCRCPECGMILAFLRCPCGYVVKAGLKPSRPVVQADGTLKVMVGDIFKPRRISQDTRGPKDWERMYYRSKTEKGRRTFKAAAALFAQEHNWGWPDPTWRLMPRCEFPNDADMFRFVDEVPMERLR